MAPSIRAVAVGILVATLSCGAFATGSSAIIEIRTAGLDAAQIAPDEQQVATLAFHKTNPSTVPIEIQIWDFRKRMLLRTQHFEEAILSRTFDASRLAYSTDGLLLAAYAGRGETVHVLRPSDLLDLHQIPLELGSSRLTGFEISPSSHTLAVCRSFDNENGGDIRIYDLDSGKEIRRWVIAGGNQSLSGLAWRSDGRVLAVAASIYAPFKRLAGTIYVFDRDSETPVNRFRVGFLPGSLAFGGDDNLYVSSAMSGGYFAHWTTDLAIFNAQTGKQTGRIRAGRVGIRRTIAISGNKKLLLAYADREKTTFEGLEDTLKVRDSQWQVVDIDTRQVLFTTPGTEYEQSSLSTSGRFLLLRIAGRLRILSIGSN
jgi:WD40 repeat protein